jgi:2-oxoglutarate ferredoxin oxidoreductase subunit beta
VIFLDKNPFDMGDIDYHWCPGCGNFLIRDILKETLVELDLKPEEVVLVTGIGQAAKMAHFTKMHFFNGLHGRALPVAMAVKAVNPELEVIVESGDGCTYGEGGNHLIHAIRRNINVTNVIHDNFVFGLTKGQASPTSQLGYVTKMQNLGVFVEPFNPLTFAIALNASFVARAYCGHKDQTKEILKKAITHRGYSHIDVYQPCVSFNRVNTYQWFQENTYYLDDSHDPYDRIEAFKRATEKGKYPLGIFYTNPKKTFEENLAAYRDNDMPVYKRKRDLKKVEKKLLSFI